MFISAFSIWYVLLPLIAVQYAIATFSLTRLALCNVKMRTYIIWNLIILIVIFLGSAVFLVYYYTHKSTLVTKSSKKDTLFIDVPLDKIENISDEPTSQSADTQKQKQEDESNSNDNDN